MRVLRRALLLWAALVPLTPAWSAAAGGPALEAKVRRAVETSYVHGMTDAIARTEVGAGAVPILLRLLFEPDLPRRDNVVAFLAHLDGEGMTPRLLAFLDESPGPLDDPNEERALLLVPLALGRRAARGDGQARAALDRLLQPGLSAAQRPGPSSLAPILRSQAELALARTATPPQGASSPVPGGASGGGEVAAAADTNTRRHATTLTVANHIDLTNKVSSSQASQTLGRSSSIAGTADFPADVACCTDFLLGGSAGTFGTAGDGQDSLDSDAELRTVLNLPGARVKVVRVINYCSGPGTNIIGCSFSPGNGMAVVRTGDDEILWLHEYGHNVGLDHVQDSRNVMNPFLVSTAMGLTQPQCNTYHVPHPDAEANPQDVGPCAVQTSCTDADQDGFGNPGDAVCPSGADTDCNDTNPDVNPGSRDLCNGVDNNCNGLIDENAVCDTFDVNGDGRVAGPELAWIGRAFGTCSGTWWLKADYNVDGCVDGQDLAILSSAWNCSESRSICR